MDVLIPEFALIQDVRKVGRVAVGSPTSFSPAAAAAEQCFFTGLSIY